MTSSFLLSTTTIEHESPSDRVYDFTNASSGATVTPETFAPSWTITPPGAFAPSLLFYRTSIVLMASWSFFLLTTPRVWFPSFISRWISFSLWRSVWAFVRLLYKFSQVANLDKFYNVILQCLTLFGRMAKITVVPTLFRHVDISWTV